MKRINELRVEQVKQMNQMKQVNKYTSQQKRFKKSLNEQFCEYINKGQSSETAHLVDEAIISESIETRNVNIWNDFSVKLPVDDDEKRRRKREYNRKYYEKRQSSLLCKKSENKSFFMQRKAKSVRNRRYYQKNRTELCNKAAQNRILDREKSNSYRHDYYKSHRELVSEYQQHYRLLHLDQATKYFCQYYALNREEICERRNLYTDVDYLQDIKKGPTNVCVSCGRLFFDRSMSLIKYSQLFKRNRDITVLIVFY